MLDKPPPWKDVLSKNPSVIAELFKSPELSFLISKANREYLHWDKFRFQPFPKGVESKNAWAYLKMTRMGNSEFIPISSESGLPFSLFLTKEHLKDLSHIDSYSSGTIVSHDVMPTGAQKDRLVISGLIEEAISSSQIEGANTTRKAAKAMIEFNRLPKDRDERMILNNYQAMNRIEDWKNRNLDDQFLLDLQKILTAHTLENSNDEGKFRVDEDNIVVTDKLTNEVVHIPPPMSVARSQLDQLYKFANTEDDSNYIHPFVKASILHFTLAYIHPFADGNGRSARALFYWYLLKKNYWMFKFLPISLQIKKKEWRPGYDRAYQYVETDEFDVTYFLSYKLKLARNAINDFIEYVRRKQREANRLKERLLINEEINQRQLELITFLQKNPNAEVDIQSHKEKYRVVYQTARTDILGLASKGILKQTREGKKYVYSRGENFPSA